VKFTHIVAAFGASLAFATASLAFDLEHADGVLQLADAPQRVVSFDLAHLDTLNALGIPVVGVPRSTYSGSLEKYNEMTVVGTLFEPDYDALKGAKPDLIIAGGRSASAVPKLGAVAPAVTFAADPADFLASVKASAQAIGKAWNKEVQAVAAFDAIQKNVDALHAANRGKTGALLFVVKGNIVAHAPGDRFGYMHELTGLKSVLPPKTDAGAAAPRPEPGSPQAEAAARERARTLSAVAQADPDWLVVLDRGAINEGEKTARDTLARHPQFSQTTAFRKGQVYYVDPNGWYVVGGGLNNLNAITSRMLSAMK